jgi:hypothetical protein
MPKDITITLFGFKDFVPPSYDSFYNFVAKCVMQGGDAVGLIQEGNFPLQSYKMVYVCASITEYGLVIISRHIALTAIFL